MSAHREAEPLELSGQWLSHWQVGSLKGRSGSADTALQGAAQVRAVHAAAPSATPGCTLVLVRHRAAAARRPRAAQARTVRQAVLQPQAAAPPRYVRVAWRARRLGRAAAAAGRQAAKVGAVHVRRPAPGAGGRRIDGQLQARAAAAGACAQSRSAHAAPPSGQTCGPCMGGLAPLALAQQY